MDFPINIDTISMDLSVLYFKGSQVKISRFYYTVFIFLSLTISVLILANSADHDEMLLYAAFHQGLHCLLKYPFINIQNEKV